jgi:hypothetical protein
VASLRTALERFLQIEERINAIEAIVAPVSPRVASLRIRYLPIRAMAQCIAAAVDAQNARLFAPHAAALSRILQPYTGKPEAPAHPAERHEGPKRCSASAAFCA